MPTEQTSNQKADGENNPPIPVHPSSSDEPVPRSRLWKQFLNETKIHDRIIALATVMIVIANCFYAYFVWKQIQGAHLDQRAWVGPIEIAPPDFRVGDKPAFIREGSKAIVGVIISNSGKTPALKVTTGVSMKSLPAGTQFTATYEKPSQPSSVSVLQPGMRMRLDSLPTNEVINKRHVEGLGKAEYFLYLYGIINYEDTFREAHQTTFCYRLTPDLAGLLTCDTYNSAN